MKISKYNSFFMYDDEDNKYIAYNAKSNSLALIDHNNYQKYMNFKENNTPIEDEELIEDLKKGKFLIDDDVDELKELQFNMNKYRYSTNVFGLTIAPTSDCNFRCIYCYEKDSLTSQKMSEETQKNIVAWLENRANALENFSVTWYGGEPLLELEIIKYLSNEFIRICKENSITYNARMITNGYHLTEDVINTLEECKITFVQVTIDGNEKIHDERRPLVGGQPTFEKIISNLSNLKGHIQNVALRINVDNENIDGVYELVDMLVEKGLNEVVRPYLGHVDNSNDCYIKSTCLDYGKYCEDDFKFNNYLKSRGFNVNHKKYYPKSKANVCMADSLNGYVINANGDLYSCWNDIGIEKLAIGNVNKLESTSTINNTWLEYLMYDPTSDVECANCNILPICMGGCPNKRIFKHENRCTNEKFMLAAYLQDIASTLKQQKATSEA